MRKLTGLLSVAVLLTAMTAGAATAGFRSVSDGGTTTPGIDTGSAIVQLKGDPLSTYVKTKPPAGKKIDFSSDTVKSYRAQLSALRNDFKQWLQTNAPAAQVVGQYDIGLNAVAVRLNGVSLGTIASAPMVQKASYEAVYTPQVEDPDLALISAPAAWAANGGSSANAGTGVKVAIVDTGIDITNPCFSDAGYPAQQQLGDKKYTNNKVIVAKVFNNMTPRFNYDAAPVQEHGTHVAGTAACDFGTSANVNGVPITHTISGVAPHALLGNYNVFPGNDLNARSEDIVNALEAAYQDGFDVANMSLGGNSHGIQDLLTNEVNDLDQANMVVAVAAGNSGPGHFTIQSPGSAARALTAGAATVGHFIATPVVAGGTTYNAASGDFKTVSADLTAPLAITSGSGVNGLNTACSALSGVSGDIALISRGTCTFSTKIRNAQNAGAVAVIVGNNVGGDPIAMGQDGTPNQPTIPAYMISMTDAGALKAANPTSATIKAQQQYVITGNDDIMAGFSSQGPTDVDFRVKPDAVAPGVNVLSSIPAGFCATPPCFAFFQGTSMATPHLAGSAAIVKWEHPAWTAAQIRSAVVNTADAGVLKQSNGTPFTTPDSNITGAGRENLLNAVQASVALDPVSTSFGAVASGSGKASTASVTVTNLRGSAATYSIAVGAGDSSVHYSVSPSSLSLAPGATGTITITMSVVKGAAAGGHQAWLTISLGGSPVAHTVVFTLIK